MKFTTTFSFLFTFSSVVLGVVNALPSNFTERDWEHLQARAPKAVTKCTKPNTVALTFDDGPYIYQKTIVDTLNSKKAKGTFFLNGNNYGCIYSSANRASIKYAYQHGHQIASHTWSHPHLKKLSKTQVTTELSKVDDALKRILGVVPAMMRPPYGEYNDNVLNVASSRGQKVIIWDFDSGDSAGVSASQSKNLYKQIANKHPSTILTLNHETYASTAHDVLPNAIATLQSKGYKLVTVAECLGLPAYKSIGSPGQYDSKTWKC
jgi:peptidoglycan/xylan/chitin deacetylase (PgdA/CDA1 family)